MATGLRLEKSTTETTDFAGISNSSSEFFALPSVNAVYNVLPQVDLRLGVARTLRRPDLGELTPTVSQEGGTLGDPDTGGNAGLTPESIWGLDMGTDYYFNQQAGHFGVNLFARKFDDKIEAVSAQESGRFVSRPQNAGDGRMYGIEIEGRLPLTALKLDDVTLWGNATHADTELKTSDGDTRRFSEQHDYISNIGLDWYLPKWRTTFGIDANWTSGYDQKIKAADGSFVTNKLGSMTRTDMSVRTDVTDDISVSLSLLNIFAPTESRTDSSYDTAGVLDSRSEETENTYRSAYLRASWKF